MTKLTTELTSRPNARAEIIPFMGDICAIPNMKSQIKDAGEKCAIVMRKRTFDEVRFDVMGNILGRIANGPRHIVFDSHIDTVDIGDRTHCACITHTPGVCVRHFLRFAATTFCL
jgi:acetylornithine deacetylase/succinyl-diaminopimelate desuccinylase-like protein